VAALAHQLDCWITKEPVDNHRARRDDEERGVDPSIPQLRLGVVVGQGEHLRVLRRHPAGSKELER